MIPYRFDIQLMPRKGFHVSHTIASYVSIPAVYEYRFVPRLPLYFGELLHNIHHTLEVGTLSIWSPASDVELSHMMGLVGL